MLCRDGFVPQHPVAHEPIGQVGILAVQPDYDQPPDRRFRRPPASQRAPEQAKGPQQHREQRDDDRRKEDEERGQYREAGARADVGFRRR